MWQPFDFYGETIGRVRAVSPPTDRRGNVLVWADNGLFNVWAFRNVTVAKLGPASEAAACFDPVSGVMSWNAPTFAADSAYSAGLMLPCFEPVF